jgi:hypothetical protein
MVYSGFRSLSPVGLLINSVEIGLISFSSPPDVVPALAGVRIASGNPIGCIVAMSGGFWICRRKGARFRCASRFADFAALSPVARHRIFAVSTPVES